MKKNWKKAVSFIAASALAVSLLAACGSSDDSSAEAEEAVSVETETETTAERETITIGISWRDMDEAMTRWSDATDALIEEYNADDSNPYYIEYFSTNSEATVDTQLSTVDSLIVREPDVICIQSVDSDGTVPAFEACTEAGIKTINFGYGINYEDYTASIMMMDHVRCGEMQKEWLENYLDENPDEHLNIVYINGAQGIIDMEQRQEGFFEIFEGEYADRVTLLDSTYANFSADTAMERMEDWLQTFPEVNCVVSANDEMCLGALQACIAAQHDVIALGMDGNNVGMEAIINDGYSGTVGFDFELVAQRGLELAIAVATGGDYDVENSIADETTRMIDASNVYDYYTGE